MSALDRDAVRDIARAEIHKELKAQQLFELWKRPPMDRQQCNDIVDAKLGTFSTLLNDRVDVQVERSLSSRSELKGILDRHTSTIKHSLEQNKRELTKLHEDQLVQTRSEMERSARDVVDNVLSQGDGSTFVKGIEKRVQANLSPNYYGVIFVSMLAGFAGGWLATNHNKKN